MSEELIINNVILENKHYYMQVMQNIETLRKKIEYIVLNDDISQKQLKEIQKIWNYTFVGLLREGLAYDYIKNANNPEKDFLRLTIDNIHYDCSLKTVKQILQDDFDEIITLEDNLSPDEKQYFKKEQEEKIKNKEIISEELKEKEEDAIEIKAEKLETMQEAEVEIEKKPEEKKEIIAKEDEVKKEPAEKVIIEEEKIVEENTTKEDVIIEENNEKETVLEPITEEDIESPTESEEESYVPEITNTAIKTQPYYNQFYEQRKKVDTFIYDVHHISVFQPGIDLSDDMDVIVCPLRMSENDLHPKIFASITYKNNTECYLSQDTSAFVANFLEYDFLIRGTFKDGNFKSYVVAAQQTSAMGCNINDEIDEYRLKNKKEANYGHIVYAAKDMVINIVPLSFNTNEKETADVLVCVERENAENFVCTSINAETLVLTSETARVQILNYWQGDMLCSEILTEEEL